MTFPRTTTVVPGGRRTGLTCMLTAGVGAALSERATLDRLTHHCEIIETGNERRLHSALGYLSPNRFEEEQPRKPVKAAA